MIIFYSKVLFPSFMFSLINNTKYKTKRNNNLIFIQVITKHIKPIVPFLFEKKISIYLK